MSLTDVLQPVTETQVRDTYAASSASPLVFARNEVSFQYVGNNNIDGMK
jgi:hypothetical protein